MEIKHLNLLYLAKILHQRRFEYFIYIRKEKKALHLLNKVKRKRSTKSTEQTQDSRRKTVIQKE